MRKFKGWKNKRESQLQKDLNAIKTKIWSDEVVGKEEI